MYTPVRRGSLKRRMRKSSLCIRSWSIPPPEGHGLGRAFETFYEQEAARQGCRYLRIDTNVRNTRARRLYHSLGYKEISVAPCTFNGLSNIDLVLLEKHFEIHTQKPADGNYILSAGFVIRFLACRPGR